MLDKIDKKYPFFFLDFKIIIFVIIFCFSFVHNHPVNWESENAWLNWINNFSTLVLSWKAFRYAYIDYERKHRIIWYKQKTEQGEEFDYPLSYYMDYDKIKYDSRLNSILIYLICGGAWIITCVIGFDLFGILKELKDD